MNQTQVLVADNELREEYEIGSDLDSIGQLREELQSYAGHPGDPGDPKGVSFQMEQWEFERMETARFGLREANRSTFIKHAIAHYIDEFERTGQRPGSRAARSKGDRIMELMDILDLRGEDWGQLIENLDQSDSLAHDSYWRLVFERIGKLIEE